jgi:hypothetical protein
MSREENWSRAPVRVRAWRAASLHLLVAFPDPMSEALLPPAKRCRGNHEQ